MTIAVSTLPKIEVRDQALDNGLRLLMVENHHSPVVGICVSYRVGSRYEQPGRSGLAHLFEHLMFEGSTNVGKTEHFGIVNAAGGTLNGGTGMDLTIYHEQLPSHQLELAMWLEADRMGGLLDAVNQEALDNQRDVVKNERRSGMDNAPYGRNEEWMIEHIYPEGHPYYHSIIGSMDDLDAASLEDVHEFFRTFYAPNNAVLAIAGDFEPGQAVEWAAKHYGHIPPREGIPGAPDGHLPPLIGEERRETISDRVQLSRFYCGYRAPQDTGNNRELYALELASRVLAHGRNSRLHRRLVLEEQLAQDTGIGVNELIGGPSMALGVVTARMGADIGRVEAAYHEVVESLASVPPDEAEMERARAGLERQYGDMLSEASGVATSVAWSTNSFGDPEQINRELPTRLDITADEISAAAERYFRPDNRAVLTFVPGETVAG